MSFKFTVIKKNQILASAVTLMLVTAGYLNYKYDPTKPYDIELTGIIEENLGDAVLVDANGNIDSEAIVETTPVFQNSTNLEDIVGEKEVENKIEEEYFVSTRIDRTNNYAEQIESYENIINSVNASDEQKNKAQEEITKINQIRNSIMIAENLIKLKGFEESVILVNENSVNVIIEAENLTSVEVAQVQSIIVSEFSVELANVHITNYEK